MAPSERSSPEKSRYLTSSSEKKESPPAEGGLESAEHFISNEEHWAHHRSESESMAKLHDESRNSKGDHRLPHLPRRTPRNKGTSSNNNSTFPIESVPEIKYVKGEILSPTSLASEQQQHQYTPSAPGDPAYMSPKATSQYQLHPGHVENNGGNGNGNYNGNNGAPPNRPYHNSGIHPAHPPPLHNYPPYHHYPQPAGYPYYHDPHGQFVISNTTSTGVDVRGEEVGIVIVVLLLWVGAIILFFNRWGKIRMLEPYQPKFCENHRPSCPMAENANQSRAFSKFNLSTEMLASPHFVKCNYHGIPASDPIPGFSGLSTTMMPGGGLTIPGAGFPTGGSTGMLSSHRNSNSFMMNHHHQHHQHRPRQNSVFVTSPSSQVSFYGSDTTLKNTSRKTKSAVDLPTLVLSGDFVDNVRRNSKNSITQL